MDNYYYELLSFNLFLGCCAYAGCINYIDRFMSMMEYMVIYCNVLLIYQFPLMSCSEKAPLYSKILYDFMVLRSSEFVQNCNNLYRMLCAFPFASPFEIQKTAHLKWLYCIWTIGFGRALILPFELFQSHLHVCNARDIHIAHKHGLIIYNVCVVFNIAWMIFWAANHNYDYPIN